MKIRSIILTYITVLIMSISFLGYAAEPKPADVEPRQIITIINDLDYTIVGWVSHMFCEFKYKGQVKRLSFCPGAMAELVPGRMYTMDVTGWKRSSFDVKGYEGLDIWDVTFVNTSGRWELPKFNRATVFFHPAIYREVEIYASQLLQVGGGE
jgi:hypothetical protein